MTDYRFISQMRLGSALPAFNERQIKNEPMLFSADPEFAWENGNAITRAFLDALGPLPEGSVIDTRVHMLMPGWFPCIPGWHHDDVPRARRDGQPVYQQWSEVNVGNVQPAGSADASLISA